MVYKNGTSTSEVKLGTHEEMPSASGKGGVTEIRLAFLPKNSPYPSPLSVPPAKKKKKIKGIKYQFLIHWKSVSER